MAGLPQFTPPPPTFFPPYPHFDTPYKQEAVKPESVNPEDYDDV